MKYRYSIIIPHYNDTKRLERLLNSIPWCNPKIEVIVIDDCSPKQQPIKELQDRIPKVKWYSSEENMGAGHARNIGLKIAQGDYLLFADSDDEFTPKAFKHIDSALKNHSELSYFLANAVQEIDNQPSNRAKPFNKLCIDYLTKRSAKQLQNLKGEHVIPVAKVYCRDFIKKTGLYFDETRVSNDISFNVLAAFKAKKIQVIPKTIYTIYRRKGSLTADVSAETFLTRLYVLTQLATRLKEEGIQHRPSSTDALLTSIKYGPKVFLKVLKISITSDLKFNILKIFSVDRWFNFFNRKYKTRKELNKTK